MTTQVSTPPAVPASARRQATGAPRFYMARFGAPSWTVYDRDAGHAAIATGLTAHAASELVSAYNAPRPLPLTEAALIESDRAYWQGGAW